MRLDPDTLRALGAAAGIGFSIAASILIGVLGGLWVDRRLGTGPFGLIAGIIFGLISVGTIVHELTTILKRTNVRGKDHRDRHHND